MARTNPSPEFPMEAIQRVIAAIKSGQVFNREFLSDVAYLFAWFTTFGGGGLEAPSQAATADEGLAVQESANARCEAVAELIRCCEGVSGQGIDDEQVLSASRSREGFRDLLKLAVGALWAYIQTVKVDDIKDLII